MATHTALELNAETIRRSEHHPEYVLLQLVGSDHKVIGIVSKVELTTIPILVDGYVRMPDDDSRFPGEVCEWFIVRGDGFDLDADFEFHASELAEETRILRAEYEAEGIQI